MRIKQMFAAATLSMVLTSCASVDSSNSNYGDKLSKTDTVPLCENDSAEIRADHITARLNNCEVISSNSFAFTITPEAKTDPQGVAINNSAWYGFRVDPKKAGNLRVSLNYENGKHRYRPKKSFDGVNWTIIPQSRLNLIRKDKLDVRLKQMDGLSLFRHRKYLPLKRMMLGQIKWRRYHMYRNQLLANPEKGIHCKCLRFKQNQKKRSLMWLGLDGSTHRKSQAR